jgi:hypothetical protein
MKESSYLTFLILLFVSHSACGWGQTAHRVTGAIAEQYLTDEARIAIQKILPGESLAEASTWADEMRSDPGVFWQKTASPWHYVTVPSGKRYGDIGAPKQGDAASALAGFRETLLDQKARKVDKQLALRFIVHLVGDLHQPLHSGNGTDRGGNDLKVTFMGKSSNLHRVWDSDLVNHQKLSYSEWVLWLNGKITESDVDSWSVTNPQVWIAESVEIRDTIYPATRSVSWDYIYNNMPIVRKRLRQAGIRLAAYLNEIFADIE